MRNFLIGKWLPNGYLHGNGKRIFALCCKIQHLRQSCVFRLLGKRYSRYSIKWTFFLTQVNHLFLKKNSFRKQAINQAYFHTQNLGSIRSLPAQLFHQSFLKLKVNLWAVTFEKEVKLIPNFESVKICMIGVYLSCLKKLGSSLLRKKVHLNENLLYIGHTLRLVNQHFLRVKSSILCTMWYPWVFFTTWKTSERHTSLIQTAHLQP